MPEGEYRDDLNASRNIRDTDRRRDIRRDCLGYEETITSQAGISVSAVTLHGYVPRPKGYNLITLPDQVSCDRISDGQEWRLLLPFNVAPARQFHDVVVSLPTGQRYANQMEEQPYTRFGITKEAKSQIVPTRIRYQQ